MQQLAHQRWWGRLGGRRKGAREQSSPFSVGVHNPLYGNANPLPRQAGPTHGRHSRVVIPRSSFPRKRESTLSICKCDEFRKPIGSRWVPAFAGMTTLQRPLKVSDRNGVEHRRRYRTRRHPAILSIEERRQPVPPTHIDARIVNLHLEHEIRAARVRCGLGGKISTGAIEGATRHETATSTSAVALSRRDRARRPEISFATPDPPRDDSGHRIARRHVVPPRQQHRPRRRDIHHRERATLEVVFRQMVVPTAAAGCAEDGEGGSESRYGASMGYYRMEHRCLLRSGGTIPDARVPRSGTGPKWHCGGRRRYALKHGR